MGKHRQALEQALQVLSGEPYCKYIDEIYLFGSCAAGKQKYDSDVDLLIQYNSSFSSEEGRSMRTAVMFEEPLPEVELKFVDGNGWKKRQDPFSRNLRKDGILLWKRL